MKNSLKQKKGFTLIELLLSVVAIALISAIVIPVSNSTAVSGDLDSAARRVESALRKAHEFALSGENSSDWGVVITSEKNVVVFSGSSYDDRDTNYDEINNLPLSATITSSDGSAGTISIFTSSGMIFASGTGLPTETGDLTFSAGSTTKSILLSVGEKGTISVNNLRNGYGDTVLKVSDLSQASASIQSALTTAVNNAKEGENNWGVAISGNTVVVFTGSDFGKRDESSDQVTVLPSAVNISSSDGSLGTSSIFTTSGMIFSKGTAFPRETGSLALSTSESKTTITIFVNSDGSLKIDGGELVDIPKS